MALIGIVVDFPRASDAIVGPPVPDLDNISWEDGSSMEWEDNTAIDWDNM
jgi:hypothetical protein